MANEFKDLITRLEKQKTAIERALAALQDIDDAEEVSAPTAAVTKTKAKGKRKRQVSDEARARMVEGQKKRWAVKRAAEKAAVKKAARKRSAKKATAKEA